MLLATLEQTERPLPYRNRTVPVVVLRFFLCQYDPYLPVVGTLMLLLTRYLAGGLLRTGSIG